MADVNTKRIIVVDSDPDSFEPLERRLRQRGLDPLVLRRGERVVKTVKDEKPGAVILELTLPDMDGYQVLKQLKDDWEAKKVPVLVVSEYTSRLDYKGREWAEQIVTKPVDLDELVDRVQTAASKKRD
ncbi:MAG: response regulator transcription factor [Chloroflexi bacterium]|nr:response regulator transcription factor [Chloroflexota bacterium]